jgi:hypothetical protein
VWLNAVDGNTGNNATAIQQGYLGSFASFQTTYGSSLSSYMGAWGIDSSLDQAWAVVNHNSPFAVVSLVPEPTSAGLILLAGCVASSSRWRARGRIEKSRR